jgi:hypothetical protein
MVTAPSHTAVCTPGEVALCDLRLRLAPLARAMTVEVERWATQTGRLTEPRSSPMAITERHARLLLDRATAFTAAPGEYGPGLSPTPAERELLDRLNEHARRSGVAVPCAELVDRGLREMDLSLLLMVAAPAFDASFGGLYAYLQDSFEATAPGPRLAVRLLATSPETERLATDAAGPFGLLRSTGLIEVTAPDRLVGPMLRPAPLVVEMLHGSIVDLSLLGLPAPPGAPGPLPVGVRARDVADLAAALFSGEVDVVGVWAAGRGGAEAVVAALCGDRPPIRVDAASVERGLQRARLSESICVIEIAHDTTDEQADALVGVLSRSTTPTVIVASRALRLARLWAGRRVAELHVPEPRRADLRRVWTDAFPGHSEAEVDDLARRFTLAPDDVDAVAALDRTTRSWSSNGSRPALDELAARVSRPRSTRLAAIRTPRRGRDLLVLPDVERRRVFEVADDFRTWPRVAEAWRLDRFGNAGITALFAGPPGTGKTLAAEVIAGEIGLDLMVVDLSLLVSKWIGETEKNLDAVFTEAGASNCVLFFDEADTLFGRRGEVTRGADRYANLEVGYLLQRLDRYEGLVVLATNLRDQVDDAFTRRFHHLVHFPKPGPCERRRLWELMLSPPVVLDELVDLDVLTELDLTGAGIAAVVRSAALAAHHDGRSALRMADLVRAVSRQFQRESRLVPRELLGTYADVL